MFHPSYIYLNCSGFRLGYRYMQSMNTVEPSSIISEGTVKKKQYLWEINSLGKALNTRKQLKMKILNFTLAPTEIIKTSPFFTCVQIAF